MDQPDILREFSEKVHTILAFPDPQTILDALRELAEGRTATLQDGAQIEALSGLGNQALGQDPRGLYTQTMSAILRWALKTFPNQSRWGARIFPRESADEPNLWETMALLDGPQGYNQRLIEPRKLIYDDLVARLNPPEPTVCGFAVPVPYVLTPSDRLTPSQREPVQPMDEDLPYIPGFFRSSARAIVATRCKFGWPELSVDCLCLYVDADNTTSIENVITSLVEVVIIKEAKIAHAVDNLSKAQKLLKPTGLSSLELSERGSTTWPPLSWTVHLSDGKRIEGLDWVFLSPCGVEEPSKTYALTAYHVAPFKTADERRIITPGGLDILTQLQEKVETRRPGSHEEIEILLRRWNEACGHAEYGHIGSTQEGWRSDFALIHLDDHWRGVNGQWYLDRMSDLYAHTEKSSFSGACGIVGSIDPQAGDIVYKDGAATSCTVGRISSSQVYLFQPGTDATAPDVVRTKLLKLHPLDRTKDVCDPGDSGSGIFMPAPQEKGWKWAGQLVSKVDPVDGGPPLGLVVPQSKVLKSLEENTGMVWRLSG